MTDNIADSLPTPGPVEAQVSLGPWTLDVRQGWRPGRGKLPELRSPSDHGLIQTSVAEVTPTASAEAISLTAKTTLESAGLPDAPIGKVMALPSGEMLVGGAGPMRGGLNISVLIVGKLTSMLVMTYIHDGTNLQEQADAEATMASARLGPEPAERPGLLRRLFG
jgi:hypothetical protein